VKPPDPLLDGRSLVPLLKQPDAPWPHPSFTSYGEHYASVRDERWRYIRYPDGTEELYDHHDDPWEWNNRARDPSTQSIRNRLAAFIPDDWTVSLGGRSEVSPTP